jgi:L-alanine-DL-glutamate epimerase-like enolase superfamily enzyme
VHLGAACPQNYIGFEYAKGQPGGGDIGRLPNPIVKDGYIDVWDKPGLGVTFNVRAAKAHLSDDDHFLRLSRIGPRCESPRNQWR